MKPPKYPIVLVHGMMAKDFAFYPAFRGIVNFLRQQDIPVYVTNRTASAPSPAMPHS